MALLEKLAHLKPASAKGKYFKTVTVSSAMGPGIRIDANEVQNITEGE